MQPSTNKGESLAANGKATHDTALHLACLLLQHTPQAHLSSQPLQCSKMDPMLSQHLEPINDWNNNAQAMPSTTYKCDLPGHACCPTTSISRCQAHRGTQGTS